MKGRIIPALQRRWRARPAQLRRLAASGLFVADWYLRRYPDVQGAEVDPAGHYLACGAAEGRDPGPGFSTSGYLLQAVAAGLTLAGENPALHFLRRGRAQGLQALPGFEGDQPCPGAPLILFVGHQAQAHLFGAERSLLHMLDRAGQAGLACVVLLPQVLNPTYLRALQARTRRVHLVPYGWRQGDLAPDPDAVAAIAALIRATGAVELHQNTAVLDAPLLAARRCGIPAVVYLRELPAEDAELCARLRLTAPVLRDRLVAEADRFVANSGAVARWIDAPKDCLILPNSIDDSLFDLPFAPQNPLRVGLISSNVLKKGLGDMLALAWLAAARFPEGRHSVNPPFQFVLVGPDSADLARMQPLPAGVVHTGYRPDPAKALAEVDVLLCLSHFAESFGRTVYEALAAGRPVVCYDRGTPPDLVGNTGAGQVVPADDPAAVLAALERLAQDPATLHAASAAARVRAAAIRAIAAGVDDRALYPNALNQVFSPRL